MSNVKKFLSSVGTVYLYSNEDGTEIFRGKTLIDSSIEVAVGNTDVRGGIGNSLLYTYYHTAEFMVNVTEAQFNLAFLGASVGSDLSTGVDMFTEETVTLGGGGAGTLVGTALAFPGLSSVFAWIRHKDGTIEKVTVTGNSFTATGSSGDVVCARYYALASAAQYININANILPKIGRMVIEAQLNSSDSTVNRIGTMQVIIPKAQLQPSFSIAMQADGVANTPISAKALVDEDLTTAACSSVPVLAKIIEKIDSANWWDGVVALAIVGGDFELTSVITSKTLQVFALRNDGTAAFVVPDLADVTFSSATVGTATINAAGVVSRVAAGTTWIKVTLDADNSIDSNVLCTVSS